MTDQVNSWQRQRPLSEPSIGAGTFMLGVFVLAVVFALGTVVGMVVATGPTP